MKLSAAVRCSRRSMLRSSTYRLMALMACCLRFQSRTRMVVANVAQPARANMPSREIGAFIASVLTAIESPVVAMRLL